MQQFNNLADLLREYRKRRQLTQETLAAKLKFNVKEIQRWEKRDASLRTPASDESLSRLAECTCIPFPVLVHLNANLPILYDLRTRRFALCPLDEDMPRAAKESAADLNVTVHVWKHRTISKPHDAELIHEFDHGIYATDKPISEKMYLAAGRFLPTLNVIVEDSRGFYCGHFVGIPLRRDIHEQMRQGKMSEGDLREADVCALDAPNGGNLYLCSLYASHAAIGAWLCRHFARFLKDWKTSHPRKDITISAYTVTADGDRCCRQLGFHEVFSNEDEGQEFDTEVTPAFYEVKASEFIRENLRWKAANR